MLGLLGMVGGAAAVVILAIAAEDVRSVEDLETGQCINANGIKQGDDDSVGIITEVDCSEDHDGQVIATKTLSEDEADSYDFGDQEQIASNCGDMLDPELFAKLNDPKYFLAALTASKTPDGGDQVSCVITLANGDDLTEDLL